MLLLGVGGGLWRLARRPPEGAVSAPSTAIATDAIAVTAPATAVATAPGPSSPSLPEGASPGSVGKPEAPIPPATDDDDGKKLGPPPPERPGTPTTMVVSPAALSAVAALLTELTPEAGAPAHDGTRRFADPAAFARAAALDGAGRATVDATVDRFNSIAEEVGANVAASPPAVALATRGANGTFPPAAAETITQLAEAYQRASEELQSLVGSGSAATAPTLSLGQQLSPDLRQRLLLLSEWLPAR